MYTYAFLRPRHKGYLDREAFMGKYAANVTEITLSCCQSVPLVYFVKSKGLMRRAERRKMGRYIKRSRQEVI